MEISSMNKFDMCTLAFSVSRLSLYREKWLSLRRSIVLDNYLLFGHLARSKLLVALWHCPLQFLLNVEINIKLIVNISLLFKNINYKRIKISFIQIKQFGNFFLYVSQYTFRNILSNIYKFLIVYKQLHSYENIEFFTLL